MVKEPKLNETTETFSRKSGEKYYRPYDYVEHYKAPKHKYTISVIMWILFLYAVVAIPFFLLKGK